MLSLASPQCVFSSLLLSSLLLATSGPSRAEWINQRLTPGPGTEANDRSEAVDLSSDGKTVVFSSNATNWVANDTFQGSKAIAFDLVTGNAEIVSRRPADNAVLDAQGPVVSRDGRHVAFLSFLSAIEPGQPLPGRQVLRKDRLTGELKLASATAAGTPDAQATIPSGVTSAISISGNGRYVAFVASKFNADTSNYRRVYVKDMDTGQVEWVSAGYPGSTNAGNCNIYPQALSDDGRYVTMFCENELLPGVRQNQIYVRDRVQGVTELVSRSNTAPTGSSATPNYPAMSPSGRFITFYAGSFGGLGFANGSNRDDNSGLFLHDRQTQTTISIAKLEQTARDGCRVSDVSNSGTVLLGCQMLNAEDGSSRSNQVFMHIPGTGGASWLLSTTINGLLGNGHSGDSLALNASGLSLAYTSVATNLDPSDGNNTQDIFVQVDSLLLHGLFSDGFED